jgi:hypothetical protein
MARCFGQLCGANVSLADGGVPRWWLQRLGWKLEIGLPSDDKRAELAARKKRVRKALMGGMVEDAQYGFVGKR